VSRFLPMKVYTIENDAVRIPGFEHIAKHEHVIMKKRGTSGFKVLGRKSFVQVVRHFRKLREDFIETFTKIPQPGLNQSQYAILVGHSGIGKSLAFSQEYQVQAFKKKENLAFYSVPEGMVYLYYHKDGGYICQKANVTSEIFWTSKTWQDFDGVNAHLVIDPRRGKGPGAFQHYMVKAFVVYLTSPNSELKKFEDEIRDLPYEETCVNRCDIEEIRVVAEVLSLDFKKLARRMERTGGQLRPLVAEHRYEKFKREQDDAWKKIATSNAEMIHIGHQKVSSKIFALEALLKEGKSPDETVLFSTEKIIVPQSAWVISKIYEKHHQRVVTEMKGLEAEKWFFMELCRGCKLECRPLPKNIAKSKGLKGKKHTFEPKSQLKTYLSGGGNNNDQFREDVKKSESKDAFFVCPKGFPAIDGASSRRELFQATIAGDKRVKQATIDLLKEFGATKDNKADLYFIVPSMGCENFSISFQGGVNGRVGKVALEIANFWVAGIDVIESITKHWDKVLRE